MVDYNSGIRHTSDKHPGAARMVQMDMSNDDIVDILRSNANLPDSIENGIYRSGWAGVN